MLPTAAGVLFAGILLTFCFTPMSLLLLRDADTGWHVVAGRQMLATHAVPRVDDFSFTRRGEPWFAWEWIFDVAAGAAYSARGLGAVAALGALLVAASFGLLYRRLVQRGAPVPLALILTLLAFAAGVVHLHARPHLVSWLMVVVWIEVLERWQQARSRMVWWLPLLMVLWVNLHGGWLLGIALVGICSLAAVVMPNRGRPGSIILGVLVACVAASFVNPYGAQLHAHVARYLGDSYLMSNIQEFGRPNFHEGSALAFEALLLIAIAAFAFGRPRTVDVLIALFSVYLGLTATRNLPLAAILIACAMAPALADAVARGAAGRRPWQRFAGAVVRSSQRMVATEMQLTGALLPAVAIGVVALALVVRRGELRNAQFDARFPAAAATFLAAQHAERVFSTDQWSSYFIFRLYPQTRVAFDDRHDFYGSEFVRRYVQTIESRPGWEKLLNESGADYVVLPKDATLSAVLRQQSAWRVVFEDQTSVVFRRAAP
jgi:hypothetical protein